MKLKSLTLCYLFFLYGGLLFAQKTNACCSAPSATAIFTGFSFEKTFQGKHEIPQPLDWTDTRGKEVKFDTPDGKSSTAWKLPSPNKSEKYVILIHEWWGLNDYVKKEAEQLQKELGNVNMIALDLYDGKVATERKDAAAYMQSVTQERAEAIIGGAMTHMGSNAQIATIGWCFGGGWSLQTAILAGDQAVGCVIYYGMPEEKAERLAKLQAKVLGVFASKDGWITPKVVETFEANMASQDKKLTTRMYEAEHAFANPSSPRHDEKAAKDAWGHTVTFMKGVFEL